MLKQIYRIKVSVEYLENKKFEKKMLYIKIVRFQQTHQTIYLLDLEPKYGGTFKVNFNILNKHLPFLFNILVDDINIFSKHYNEISFGQVFSKYEFQISTKFIYRISIIQH